MPHPNAAKVFINWYMSKPSQELYESITLEASRRIDLGTSPPSYVVPGKFAYTDDYTEDYYLLSRSSLVKSLNDTLGQR